VDKITEEFNSVAIDTSTCANCGKEGNGAVMNTCNKCKVAKYCNAACKKKHRSKHKKACERRVAELHDIELFKQPPPAEDCPICFLQMPTIGAGRYMTCCGKKICGGCWYSYAVKKIMKKKGDPLCPFCRTPEYTSHEDKIQREKKRAEMNDPKAIYYQGLSYITGFWGVTIDYTKALELWHRAAELGCKDAYYTIAYCYQGGMGVKVDKKRATYYYEQAAMMGDAKARYNLGNGEMHEGNIDRALKHYMIGVRSGEPDSLETIKGLYSDGHVTKDDYTDALRSYQAYVSEVKSAQRDEAAAADDKYRYY